MKEKVLIKGNEALAEAAIRAGCRYYFGYPITPQNEVPMYMSKRMPEVGGVFLQAESEVAAINMVFGASAAGARVMTSSSSPGISLMQEGISYIAAAELPCVIVNMMRGGPGLGNIAPAQGDYFQATKGGGHGDYKLIVLAPNSVQELINLVYDAFDLADKYRNPVMILGDAILGQMSEPAFLPEFKDINSLPKKEWALTGAKNRPKNVIRTLWLHPEDRVTQHNIHLFEKYKKIKNELIYYEKFLTDDAELIIVAYGTSSRVAKSAVKILREENIKVGLFRPITLWPFPYEILNNLSSNTKNFLVLEMSMGQMIEDVQLAVNGKSKVHFLGLGGGWVPDEQVVINEIKKIL
jgi:2-oxoglutarate ferredoxin oxidoreductase subunit alpha